MLIPKPKFTLKPIQSSTVFQVKPPMNHVSIPLIEDVLSTFKPNMSYLDKKDLCYSNGIDYDNIVKYYPIVKDIIHVYMYK